MKKSFFPFFLLASLAIITYIFLVSCANRKSLSDGKADTTNNGVSQTLPATAYTGKTLFGAKIQQDKRENQINVAKQLNLSCIRPSAIQMDTYSGFPEVLVQFHNAGFICVTNIVATNTSGSNIVEYLHGADTIQFKKAFKQLCEDVKSNIGIDNFVAVIENEPINLKYYKGDFKNYLGELHMCLEIAKPYGIRVVSGAIHLQLVQAVKDKMSGDIRVEHTRQLMDFEKTHEVYATNIHHSFQPEKTKHDISDFVSLSKWLNSYTGHPVMTNEISMKGVTPQLVSGYLKMAREAKYAIYMFWSGDRFNGVKAAGNNSEGDALNSGVTLSEIGKAVAEFK